MSNISGAVVLVTKGFFLVVNSGPYAEPSVEPSADPSAEPSADPWS